MATSLDDILTAAKNLVQAVNNVSQVYQNVQGIASMQAIAAATQISTKSGRIASISITTAGTTPGTVYDTNASTNLNRPIYSIPNVVGVGPVNLPLSYGLYIVPGTGQVLTVSYSCARTK